MSDRFFNQRNIIDEHHLARQRFVVVGAGAIGSMVVNGLSKMGARNITVFDFDKLEDHNFANQMYPVSQLGKPKVEALAATASDFGDCKIIPVNKPWNPDSVKETNTELVDIVLACVDNMDVRRAIFDYYKQEGRAKFFIDGRMSAFVYKVYGIDLSTPKAIERYEKSLHPQKDSAPEPCGQKSIIYTVYAVAAQMIDQVKKYINSEYRATEVIADLFNDELMKQYDMEQTLPEPIEAKDEDNQAQ